VTHWLATTRRGAWPRPQARRQARGWSWCDLFLLQAGHKARYRFGREPDGTPAPWDWHHLA
jgi:hypothetical protein